MGCFDTITHGEKVPKGSAVLCPIAPPAKKIALRCYPSALEDCMALVCCLCSAAYGQLCRVVRWYGFGAAGATSTTAKGAIRGWTSFVLSAVGLGVLLLLCFSLLPPVGRPGAAVDVVGD